MNAVEIDESVSNLSSQPFDAAEFPFAFLAAFGNKDTTIRRLRKGETRVLALTLAKLANLANDSIKE